MLVPSESPELDKRQWPCASERGVRFVRLYEPWFTRFWVHFQRLPLGFIKAAGWPFPMPLWLKQQIASVDTVLAIGGDNYSLDYRLPSLWMGLDGYAMRAGKKTYLWGASVGPFEREPHFVGAVRQHLARFTGIVVRESVSFSYLTNTLGLTNVSQAPDPAFVLEPEPYDVSSFWPAHRGAGVLGLNVSPLLEQYTKGVVDILNETEAFVRHAVKKMGFGVLFIPHVVPLNGDVKNNDAVYMKRIKERVSDLAGAVRITPSNLNAAQLKSVISKTKFFIGARTHATIAALSSGVPTCSIAYSVKARGINRDIFGSESMVLPTTNLCRQALIRQIEHLLKNEIGMREHLLVKIPRMKQSVLDAAARIAV